MLTLLTTALFGASASGQLTMAMWAPRPYQTGNYTRVGSVLNSGLDRTIVAFTEANYTNTRVSISSPPDTFTLGGLTYVEYNATVSFEGLTTATVVVACSRANEQASDATCMQSRIGLESSMSEYCGYYFRSEMQTTTVTDVHPSRSDRPASTFTYTQTNDFRTGMPKWCTNSTAFTEQAKMPTTFDEGDMATWALVLTAGLEKLSVSVTGSGLGIGSDVSKTGGSITTPTGSVVATGAATSAYVRTLVGLGVIAAFFL
jgi:hypothetical protein